MYLAYPSSFPMACPSRINLPQTITPRKGVGTEVPVRHSSAALCISTPLCAFQSLIFAYRMQKSGNGRPRAFRTGRALLRFAPPSRYCVRLVARGVTIA